MIKVYSHTWPWHNIAMLLLKGMRAVCRVGIHVYMGWEIQKVASYVTIHSVLNHP